MRRKIIILIGVLFIVTVTLFALTTTSASTPQKTADSLVANIEKGNAAASYKLFSANQTNTLTLANWTTSLAQIKAGTGAAKLVATSKIKPQTTKTLQTYATYKATNNGTSYTLSLVLVKNAKTWQIDSLVFGADIKNKVTPTSSAYDLSE